MKTYKERTIDACKELIDKYENPDRKDFFLSCCCPLCQIYYYKKHTCKGCFMSNFGGSMGCINFRSFKEASENLKIIEDYYYTDESMKYLKKRAKFFRKIIPILKKIPAEQFTPSGWKYFNINLNW